MKAHKILGIIAAIALAIFGLVFPVPEKHLRVSSYSYNNNWMETGEEYVGGDAYNYQMEASLKAGWVSGVLSMKAICTSSGVLLFFLILMAESHEKEIRKQNECLERVISNKNSPNDSTPNQEQNAAPVPEKSQTA